MGLLKVGKPLTWEQGVVHSRYIREHGVKQFLATWRRVKDLANDRLYYGDEIEYALLKFDGETRKVRLSLRADEVLAQLRQKEQTFSGTRGCAWHQEYGSWMVESTPGGPYGGYTSSLLEVEANMRLRRARLLSVLKDDEMAPTMVCFPLMGVGDFVYPEAKPGGPASESECVPDAVINVHPRFPTLTANIRSRRKSKVQIPLPIFKDSATGDAGMVEGDAMAYGMGCCCLQVTFQAADVAESRYLYDQMAVLSPVMLAMTAAFPIFHGKLTEVDVRWSTISASVDDRTPAERGLPDAEQVPDPRMAGGGVRPLSKSRYDSISCYIQQYSQNLDKELNDIPCEQDEETFSVLKEGGLDTSLARHIAHLFVRDPLVAFEGNVTEVDDETSTEHFESINSTNWQTVRWKPPPPPGEASAHIGWRTEFRPMEVQMSDFANAAFTAFSVLVTRALLVFDLDLLMPLSKVDENMKLAHKMDAVKTCKFWFRRHVIPCSGCPFAAEAVKSPAEDVEQMTIDQIINGDSIYPGLVPLCYAYLQHIQCDYSSLSRIRIYLEFIAKRARGELMTDAAWIRKFVQSHPEYQKDSVVTPSIAFDLLKACDEIGRGERPCPEIYGDVVIDPVIKEGVYLKALDSKRNPDAGCSLLQALRQRACPEDGAGSLPSRPIFRRQLSGAAAPPE